MVGEGVGLIITIKEERGGVLPRNTRRKRGNHEIHEIHERRTYHEIREGRFLLRKPGEKNFLQV
jgi:hypothetical protein